MICRSHRVDAHYFAIYQCRCGKRFTARIDTVKAGRWQTCGCSLKGRKNHVTHGLTPKGRWAPEYHSWLAMRRRCHEPSNIGWKYYGGRGIRVCARWKDFGLFYSDMGKRPTKRHTLDRFNVNGHYTPKNCRWATKRQQRINQRPRS